jgi:hypothetical protein
MFRVYWCVTLPLLALGFVITWIGVVFEDLPVMQVGVALCFPVLPGYYAALGLIVFASVASLYTSIMARFTGARERIGRRRKRLARLPWTPSKSTWDREIDG